MSTRGTAIDLSVSDDEEETQKKRKPEMTTDLSCPCDGFAKCYLHFNYKSKMRLCGSCDRGFLDRTAVKRTGNSIGFVCEDCEENTPEMAFCVGCHRYEETDGEDLCGRCQSVTDPKKRAEYAVQPDSSSDSD